MRRDILIADMYYSKIYGYGMVVRKLEAMRESRYLIHFTSQTKAWMSDLELSEQRQIQALYLFVHDGSVYIKAVDELLLGQPSLTEIGSWSPLTARNYLGNGAEQVFRRRLTAEHWEDMFQGLMPRAYISDQEIVLENIAYPADDHKDLIHWCFERPNEFNRVVNQHEVGKATVRTLVNFRDPWGRIYRDNSLHISPGHTALWTIGTPQENLIAGEMPEESPAEPGVISLDSVNKRYYVEERILEVYGMLDLPAATNEVSETFEIERLLTEIADMVQNDVGDDERMLN